jgi:hypothetical protein
MTWLTTHVICWLELVNTEFYLISSAALHCVEYHRITKHRLFIFNFQFVSLANTANINTPSLVKYIFICSKFSSGSVTC